MARPIDTIGASGAAWLGGELTNLVLGSDGLAIANGGDFVRDGLARGIYVSRIAATDAPFDQVRASFTLTGPASGRLELEVRSSPDGVRWAPWEPVVAPGAVVSLPAGRFFQYRAELAAPPGQSPLLDGVTFDLASTGALPAEASKNNPTVHLFATREGLVGRKTANGHTIAEKDRFVALPSKRVLSPNGKRDYQVKLSYKGKSVTLPVWDVGPWNTRDNYWDAERETFRDLPRFVPQALAAWKDDYNDGRDQFNRWVSFPASIDIADGGFLDDLGMRNSDWVDVTFLWVDAPSPPRGETPPVTGLKPEPRATDGPDGQTWYFADGNTTPSFETWFLLQNPNSEPAKATLSYMMTDGSVKKQDVTLDGGARVSIYANRVVPDAEFSVRIDGSRPILAERSIYVGRDGYSAVGATEPETTWYLAEGSSQPPFDTWILLQNPSAEAARVTLTFMPDGGEDKVVEVSMPPTSRRSIHAGEMAPQAGFATRIASDRPIVAERTVRLANGGIHGSLGAAETSKTWYLAEGSTLEGFDTWLLVQNPGRGPANVAITYLRESGDPVTRKVSVPPTSRAAVRARDSVDGERFGYRVEADQPVVVERAMFFGGGPDGSGTGASDSVGAPDLAKTWYLPEGSTQAPFRELILVANPNRDEAHIRVDFVRGDGEVVGREYSLGGMDRLTIDVNAEVPNTPLSARVSADQPIVVERSSYFNDASGGTNSLGIPR